MKSRSPSSPRPGRKRGPGTTYTPPGAPRLTRTHLRPHCPSLPQPSTTTSLVCRVRSCRHAAHTVRRLPGETPLPSLPVLLPTPGRLRAGAIPQRESTRPTPPVGPRHGQARRLSIPASHGSVWPCQGEGAKNHGPLPGQGSAPTAAPPSAASPSTASPPATVPPAAAPPAAPSASAPPAGGTLPAGTPPTGTHPTASHHRVAPPPFATRPPFNALTVAPIHPAPAATPPRPPAGWSRWHQRRQWPLAGCRHRTGGPPPKDAPRGATRAGGGRRRRPRGSHRNGPPADRSGSKLPQSWTEKRRGGGQHDVVRWPPP